MSFECIFSLPADVNSLVRQLGAERDTLDALYALIQQSFSKFESTQRHLAAIVNFAKRSGEVDAIGHLMPPGMADELSTLYPDAVNEEPMEVGPMPSFKYKATADLASDE